MQLLKCTSHDPSSWDVEFLWQQCRLYSLSLFLKSTSPISFSFFFPNSYITSCLSCISFDIIFGSLVGRESVIDLFSANSAASSIHVAFSRRGDNLSLLARIKTHPHTYHIYIYLHTFTHTRTHIQTFTLHYDTLAVTRRRLGAVRDGPVTGSTLATHTGGESWEGNNIDKPGKRFIVEWF